MNRHSRLSLAALAAILSCTGDYQTLVADDGNVVTFAHGVSTGQSSSSGQRELYRYEPDRRWKVVNRSQITSDSGGYNALFSVADPSGYWAAVNDPTAKGLLLIAQADGGYSAEPLPATSPGDNSASGAISLGAGVIIDGEPSDGGILTRGAEVDGGYTRDETLDIEYPFLSEQGDRLLYFDPGQDPAPLLERQRTGPTTWTSPQSVAGLDRTSVPQDNLADALSRNGLWFAYCDVNTLRPRLLQRESGGWTMVNFDAGEFTCSVITVSDDGALTWKDSLDGTKLIRANPPDYVGEAFASTPRAFSELSVTPDGGALSVTATVPTSNSSEPRAFYLGPLALTALPGVALDAGASAQGLPSTPVLSARLIANFADSVTVSSISLQMTGTLRADGGVAAVHLFLDGDGDGLSDGGSDVELGALLPPDDGGPLVFTGFQLAVSRSPGALPDDGGPPPVPPDTFLLATADTVAGASGTLQASLDPTVMKATGDTVVYAITPLGPDIVGPQLTFEPVGTPDAGVDAGPVDLDAGVDAGVDAGEPDAGFDAGRADAGVDAGTPDAGSPDAGTPDAGTVDAGTPDAGTVDAGTVDAGTPDAGTADAGGGGDPGSTGGGKKTTGDCCGQTSKGELFMGSGVAALAWFSRKRKRAARR